jgi:hypothetical protein
MSRRVLNGASFDSTETLSSKIAEYIKAYDSNPHPFKWRKRVVRGAEIQKFNSEFKELNTRSLKMICNPNSQCYGYKKHKQVHQRRLSGLFSIPLTGSCSTSKSRKDKHTGSLRVIHDFRFPFCVVLVGTVTIGFIKGILSYSRPLCKYPSCEVLHLHRSLPCISVTFPSHPSSFRTISG